MGESMPAAAALCFFVGVGELGWDHMTLDARFSTTAVFFGTMAEDLDLGFQCSGAQQV